MTLPGASGHNPRPLIPLDQAERPANEAVHLERWIARPGNAAVEEIRPMKAGIHPVYELRTFHCYG